MKLRNHLLQVVTCAAIGLLACSREVSWTDTAGVPPGPSTITPASPGPDIGAPPEGDGSTVYNATMTGREVVPTVYETAATGTGSFSLDADGTILRYEVAHTLESPTEAHLHLGIAGESGALLLPLTIVDGVISGALTVTPEQVRAIEEGRAYVDVHSALHPDGEIRGQIARPGELVYVARLSADQENPPTEASGDGVGAFLVDGTARRMRFVVRAREISGGPTVAVIALGPAGVDGPLVIDLADPKTPPSVELMGSRTITSSEDLDLGRWYINLHTRRFPMGEVRGQILRPGQQLFVGRMNGGEVVPPVESPAGGSVSLIVDADLDRVTYDVALTGMSPTEVVLAEAPLGVNGSVLLPFEVHGGAFRARRMLPPNSTLLPSLVVGNVYSSASSTMHPAGEVRGQLRRVGLPR